MVKLYFFHFFLCQFGFIWHCLQTYNDITKCSPVGFWHCFFSVTQFDKSFLTFPPYHLTFKHPSVPFLFFTTCMLSKLFACQSSYQIPCICDKSKFAMAEKKEGGKGEVGGANDRMWARCRRTSLRWRVTDLNVEINMRIEKDESEGGRASRWKACIKSGSWLMSHLIPDLSCLSAAKSTEGLSLLSFFLQQHTFRVPTIQKGPWMASFLSLCTINKSCWTFLEHEFWIKFESKQ